MDRVNNITSGDIGNLYKITGTAMIDRSGIEVIEQSSILRGFSDDWQEYAFDIPIEVLKRGLPDHAIEFLDEEFRSKESPSTHRLIYIYVDDIDCMVEED